MPKGKRKGKSGRYIWLFYATLTLNVLVVRMLQHIALKIMLDQITVI